MSRRTNSATSRLRQDYMRLKKDPVPYIVAEPLPSNILEWHYVVEGPESSPYAGGVYKGKLVFPSEFPFKPPAIYMSTPNGRFKTDMRLCLSISDYHPDTWNPAWSVATILTGLLSFMLEKSPTLGSVETTDAEKRRLAAASHEFNLRDRTFSELFPERAAASREILEKIKAIRLQKQATNKTRPGLSSGGSSESGGDVPVGGGGGIQSTIANFLVIGGFAAFAFVVQYVLQTIAAAND